MKNSYYFGLFEKLSPYIMNEERMLFEDTRKLLEEYERHIVTPEALIESIEKRKSDPKIICSEVLFLAMEAYVNYLFLLVHAAFHFGTQKDIPDKYFGLLDKIEDFFILWRQQFPEKWTDSMQHTVLRVIMIFNTWSRVVIKEYPSVANSYEHWSHHYFERLYTNKESLPSYTVFLYSLYRSSAETVKKVCLQKIFTELSAEYGPPLKERGDLQALLISSKSK